MKFINWNIKTIALGVIVALSSGFGVAQAWSVANTPAPGCVTCWGCGPNGGIGWNSGYCIACCVPPSE
jgi:hypothetical protein